tara:strand:+ start:3493 stop:3804 length:312 start_codon:yes stop_codon:yes gene_type:complete
MARCGRCGLWNQYPTNHKEDRYAGTCLWYQIRLIEDDVFEDRDCGDFLEAVPQLSPIEHFNYKVKRDSLGDAYSDAKRSRITAAIALSVSVAGFLWGVLKEYI